MTSSARIPSQHSPRESGKWIIKWSSWLHAGCSRSQKAQQCKGTSREFWKISILQSKEVPAQLMRFTLPDRNRRRGLAMHGPDGDSACVVQYRENQTWMATVWIGLTVPDGLSQRGPHRSSTERENCIRMALRMRTWQRLVSQWLRRAVKSTQNRYLLEHEETCRLDV